MKCVLCDGTGKVKEYKVSGGKLVDPVVKVCDECGGTGVSE